MRAGRLRERITILSPPSAVRNSYGEVDPATAWGVHAVAWAEVLPQVGREAVMAAAETAQTIYKIRMRYLGSVQQEMRVRLADNTLLEIRAVQQAEHRNRETVLTCVEYNPQPGGVPT